MLNLSNSEQLTYATVRIECEYSNGTRGTGTGFFFQFLKNETTGKHVPVVITNKHVVEGAIKGRLIITKADAEGNPLDTQHFQMYFDNFETFWRKHPDVNVDLCAMPIAPFLIEAANRGEKLFYISLDKSLIPTKEQLEDLSALEEILMVGYPNGIWDTINNKPILRRGITATHPNFDYNGTKEIMIDAACFPGSSGSPVFIYNEGGYRDKRGNNYLGSSRVILLGVLYAGPQQTVQGDIEVINIPTGQRPVAISSIPINLGIVIKAERILELENLFTS